MKAKPKANLDLGRPNEIDDPRDSLIPNQIMASSGSIQQVDNSEPSTSHQFRRPGHDTYGSY
jgi:hypothetical protein